MSLPSTYVQALRPTSVLDAPSPGGRLVKSLSVGERIVYKRTIFRENRDWLKVVVEGRTTGYIEKAPTAYQISELCELDDPSATGLDYSSGKQSRPPFEQVFRPAQPSSNDQETPGFASLTREVSKEESQRLELRFNPDATNVSEFRMAKGQRFFITRKRRSKKDVTMEVECLDGTTGIVLGTLAYTELTDKWIFQLGMFLTILFSVVLFAGALSKGMIVFGFIMFIPGAIMGFLIAFSIKICLMILGGLLSPLTKRL